MNEVFKTEDAELPSCEWWKNFPFLAPKQSKNDYNSLSGSFQTVNLARRPSVQSTCVAQFSAQPPTPRAIEPSLSWSLPHLQHTHLLPLVGLWFSTFSSILPLTVCTFLCSPKSLQFQQLSRETSPFPLTAAPAAQRTVPVQLSHPLFPICQGTIFFFKLHFTSKSRAQLLVWVQSQETLRSMGEGSWCISCFMWPVYQKLHWDQEQILHPHPSFTTAPSPRHSHSRGAGEMHNRTLAAHMPAANHQVQKEVGHQLCIPADPLKAHIAGAHLSHRALAPTQRKGEVVG